MRMKILVTGSNGLLGQKLVHALHNDPEVELIASARGENRLKKVAGFRYVSLDITDAQACVHRRYQPDAVIHTMTQVDIVRPVLLQRM